MFDPFHRAKPTADFSGTACEGIAETDRDKLWDAANRFVHARGIAINLTERLSHTVVRISGRLSLAGQRVLGSGWDGIETKVRTAVESVLWKAHDLATLGLGGRGSRNPWTRLHRWSASASGAVSGFAGLPGLLLDVPVTTALMLRTIAEIARDHGEDIASDEGKRACLEVLAQGGPAGGLAGRQTGPRGENQGSRSEADEAEIGYWSARAGLSHLTIAALIRTAAARLGVTLSEKMLAQAVPVAGAVAGAGLNWAFMRYYQEIAHVHFTIRAVERRSGDAATVRACFDHLVAQARMLKQPHARGRVIDATPEMAAGNGE